MIFTHDWFYVIMQIMPIINALIFLLLPCFLFASPLKFTQAKKRVLEIYSSLNHLEDFYCKTPFQIRNGIIEIDSSSPTYTPRNKYTKKGKINKLQELISIWAGLTISNYQTKKKKLMECQLIYLYRNLDLFPNFLYKSEYFLNFSLCLSLGMVY